MAAEEKLDRILATLHRIEARLQVVEAMVHGGIGVQDQIADDVKTLVEDKVDPVAAPFDVMKLLNPPRDDD